VPEQPSSLAFDVLATAIVDSKRYEIPVTAVYHDVEWTTEQDGAKTVLRMNGPVRMIVRTDKMDEIPDFLLATIEAGDVSLPDRSTVDDRPKA
jgi:hypothetical protein